jgi:LysR family nitrogen assimilation transcriptional regulator
MNATQQASTRQSADRVVSGRRRGGALALRHLRYFVGIVEAGSIGRAAAAMLVAQPTLSQQMNELEAHAGAQLLTRNAYGSKLTPVGAALYDEAKKILSLVDRLPSIAQVEGREVMDPAAGAPRGLLSTVARTPRSG